MLKLRFSIKKMNKKKKKLKVEILSKIIGRYKDISRESSYIILLVPLDNIRPLKKYFFLLFFSRNQYHFNYATSTLFSPERLIAHIFSRLANMIERFLKVLKIYIDIHVGCQIKRE